MMITQTKKQNGREVYFNTTKEISDRVSEYIIDEIKALNLPSEIEDTLQILPKKRNSKPIMRSNLTYLIYKNLGGEKTISELVPALALSEISNDYAYLANWIFDNKNSSCTDKTKINQIVASSHIFRDLASKCISKIDVDSDKQREISDKLASASTESFYGQFLDFGTDFNKQFHDEQDYLNFYKNRSSKLSGSFYGFSSELGAILADSNKETKRVCEELGRILGTGMHISNDLGDFATLDSSFKSYQDQQSDVSNRRSTYPIYCILKYGSDEEKKLILNKTNETTKEQITKALITSGAFDKTNALLKGYEPAVKQLISDYLPKNEYGDALSSMTATISCNKFLKSLREIKCKLGDKK